MKYATYLFPGLFLLVFSLTASGCFESQSGAQNQMDVIQNEVITASALQKKKLEAMSQKVGEMHQDLEIGRAHV